MGIKQQDKDGVAVVSICDELTIYTAAELKKQLFSIWTSAQQMELDLSGVTELDSAGVQILMQLKLESEISQKPVSYVRHSQPVLQVMELLNLTSRFADPVVLSADMGASV